MPRFYLFKNSEISKNPDFFKFNLSKNNNYYTEIKNSEIFRISKNSENFQINKSKLNIEFKNSNSIFLKTIEPRLSSSISIKIIIAIQSKKSKIF